MHERAGPRPAEWPSLAPGTCGLTRTAASVGRRRDAARVFVRQFWSSVFAEVTSSGYREAPEKAAWSLAGEENSPEGTRAEGRDLLLNSWPPSRRVTCWLGWSYITPGQVAFALALEGPLQSSTWQSRTSGELSKPQMTGPAGSRERGEVGVTGTSRLSLETHPCARRDLQDGDGDNSREWTGTLEHGSLVLNGVLLPW